MNVLNFELEDRIYHFNRDFLVGMGVQGGNKVKDFTTRFAITSVSN